MRAALEAAGKRVHVYTSPHLVRFNERFRLAGELVDDERLAAALDRLRGVNAGQSISVFEITTAAALLLFSETPADYLLLEVGLGGRYDATNVIDRPAATVITPVSIDHPEFLGATVDKIAYEKAGILERGAPAMIAEQEDAGAARSSSARRCASARRASSAGAIFTCTTRTAGWCSRTRLGLVDLPLPRLPGRHQHGNAATRDRGAARDRAGASPLARSSAACSRPNGRRGCSACAGGPLVALASAARRGLARRRPQRGGRPRARRGDGRFRGAVAASAGADLRHA